MKKFLYHWLPVIVWMTFIFFMSSRQRIGLSEVFIFNFIIFKTLHMIEYAALFFLIFRALKTTFTNMSNKETLRLAVILALLYAIFDELHQTFVPTREGSIRDIGIDSIGILLCFQYTKHNLRRLKLFL
ncbi:MAG: VanZ family protein [bacterium]|nr:VanZ family protein [bacterium]